MILEKNEVIVEENMRFSESVMWSAQKSYYDEKGIDAWNEDVPNYITSNPFIGASYAKMLIAFMQDWMAKNNDAKSHPFYILELGTGTGQFSFYLLKNLLMYKKLLKLDALKFCYVMSDVTTRPFEFWDNHQALKQYIEAGVLDFAVYDLYQSDDIVLHHSQKTLNKDVLVNPLIVLANYLFDSIGNDVFTVNDGQLFESLVTVKTTDKVSEDGKPTDWEKVSIAYQEKPIAKSYYQNQFDEILFGYENQLMGTHFQFPVAGLKALQYLQGIASNRLLLVTSDKGYTTLDELDCLEYPDLDFHGSFSVMVNYHAIGEYLKKCGGSQHTQAFRENIVSGVFSSGFLLTDMPQLSFSMQQNIDGFSPTDYFLLYEHFAAHYKKCSLAELSSFLNLSEWDSHVYDQIGSHLADLAEDGDPEVVAYLAENMHKVAKNVYYSPAASDVIFDVGVFYQNISQFEQAIEYYEQSNAVFGESDITFFNIGICYHSLGNNSAAVLALKRALSLNASASDAKQWIETIEKEQALNNSQ